jgi:hypothetical protein
MGLHHLAVDWVERNQKSRPLIDLASLRILAFDTNTAGRFSHYLEQSNQISVYLLCLIFSVRSKLSRIHKNVFR